MASSVEIYNWYKRYRVLAADMTAFQAAMLGNPNAMMEGLLNGSVATGLVASTGNLMVVNVSAGVAIGPTGYLHTPASASFNFTAPSANFKRSLLVARPLLTNSGSMTNPSNPFETVSLKTKYGSQITLIDGTASTSPTYPATEANDVIVAGIRTYAGQAIISMEDIDLTVRDAVGKNSAFLQEAATYDDRLRPYRLSNTVLGIKPGQLNLKQGNATQFKASANNRGSIFPKTPAGAFNENDTFLNFQTGAVTGGDGATGSFVPTIPAANTWIVATVVLTQNNTLSVSYGTAGFRQQCFNGIRNQTASGAGSVVIPTTGQPIAFVMLTSATGASVTELDFFDARGILQGGSGGAASGLVNFWSNGDFESSAPGVLPDNYTYYSETESVVFTDAGDLVTVGSLVPAVNDTVSFTVINSTTGIAINTLYYVITVVGLTFQLSLTLGGSAIALTTNGTGTMVRGKIKTGSGGTPTITFLTTSTNPLDGSVSAQYTKPATNCMGQGVARAIVVPLGWRQPRLVTLQMLLGLNVSNLVASDLSIWVYDVDNSVVITPSVAALPKINGGWAINFLTSTATNYRVCVHVSTPNTAAYQALFDDFVLTPLPQAFPVSGPGNLQSYSPVFNGMGTPTSVNLGWAYDGDGIRIKGRFALGTTTSGAAQLGLPNNFVTAAPAGLNASVLYSAGTYRHEIGTTSSVKRGQVTYTPGNSYLNFGYDEYALAIAPSSPLNGLTLGASGEIIWIDCWVPISALSGTALLAGSGAIVEYGSNTDVTNADTTTSGFSNSINGASFGPYTGSVRTKRVRYSNPIQATDFFILQVQEVLNGPWIELNCTNLTIDVCNFVYQDTNRYGMTFTRVVGSTLEVDVIFGAYGRPSIATYGGAGTAWSGVPAAAKWRLVKCNPSAAVGFGPAGFNAPGLISSQARGSVSALFTAVFNTSLTIDYEVIGKTVTLSVPAMNTVVTGAGNQTATPAIIPAGLLPALPFQYAAVVITDTGNVLGVGFVRISSTGVITIYRNATLAGTNWTSAAVGGWGEFSITYKIL